MLRLARWERFQHKNFDARHHILMVSLALAGCDASIG